MLRQIEKTFVLLTALGAGLYAQDDHPNRRCSLNTIKGTYGFTIAGTRAVVASPGQFEQSIGVGIREYDGYGSFTQVDTSKGAIAGAAVDIHTSGTYTINSDCTGAAFVTIPGRPTPIEARFVVVNNGKEIHWIVLSPTTHMVTGHAVRR